jgi:CRISPR/Cas system-associated exonuclease Cas4 (RecB family)
MNTFSFSRLNLYQTCPRRFYYKYVLGLNDPPSEAAILGKTVHKAIELVLNGRLFDDAILTACLEEADLAVDRQEVEILVKTALVKLPLFPNSPRITEKYFLETLVAEKQVYPGIVLPKLKIQGYMDLFFKQCRVPVIVDWKTNRQPYPVNHTWQIPLYASIIMEQEKAEAVEGVLVFLRTGQVCRQIISKEMANMAREWAARLAWEINIKLYHLNTDRADPLASFNSQPSTACSHCPWCYQCLIQDTKRRHISV